MKGTKQASRESASRETLTLVGQQLFPLTLAGTGTAVRLQLILYNYSQLLRRAI